MRLFSKHETTRTIVLFHIGSGQVRAAAIVLQGGMPHMVYHTASYVPFFDLTNTERYEHATLATLLEVVMRVSTDYLSQLSRGKRKDVEFVCVFSSPWFIEATRSVTLKKKTPFAVTRALIANLQEQEYKAFIEQTKEKNDTVVPMTSIENVLVSTQLDGYTTDKPYDRRTHELRATFHITVATETLMKRVRETFSQLADHTPVRFASATFVTHHALQKLFPEEHTMLQVVISGECTDVSIIENNVLIGTQTFPHGTRSVLRTMAQQHHMNFEEAVSRSNLYLNDKQALRNDAAYASFQKGFDAWRTFFTKTMATLYSGTPLPHTAIIVAEESWQSAYATKLTSISAEMTVNDAPYKVLTCSKLTNDAHGVIKLEPDLPFDTHIVVDIVGIL